MTNLLVRLELSSFSPDGSSMETFISEIYLIFIADFHIPGCYRVPSYWLTWLEPTSCHAQDASFTDSEYLLRSCVPDVVLGFGDLTWKQVGRVLTLMRLHNMSHIVNKTCIVSWVELWPSLKNNYVQILTPGACE